MNRFLLAVLLPLAAWSGPRKMEAIRSASARRAIVFLENRGQAPVEYLWEATGPGFHAYFARDRFVFAAGASGQAAHTISFPSENGAVRLEGSEPQPGKVNLFLGKDRSHWTTGVPTFAQLRYRQIYPGIDLISYGRDGRLEYDFAVSPGVDPKADPAACGRRRSAHYSARRAASGQRNCVGTHRPILYQNVPNGRRAIAGRFAALADDTIGFDCPAYDRTQELIIDPTVTRHALMRS